MPTDTLATARRRAARRLRRAGFQGMRLYLVGLGLRRHMTMAEIVSMRLLLQRWLAAPAFRPAADTRTSAVRVRHADGEVRGEWVEAPGTGRRDHSVLLYVHGGGFVSGSPATHRGLTAKLSALTGLPVFSVDYRLAPKYRFPAAADDVLRAYRWLLDAHVAADRIVVAGDSAGGHLALGLPPRAVREALPAPAGVVAFSPVVDVSMELSRDREQTMPDPWATAKGARAVLRRYHKVDDLENPELALITDDLSVMPPVLIQAGGREFLAADAEHYAEAVRRAGGRCDLRLWPMQPHVFQVAYRLSSAAREALDDVAAFVAEVTAEAPSDALPADA